MKVTVAPAPMVSELRVWLTVPNFRLVPAPVTLTDELPVPRALFTLVVPCCATKAS